MRIGRIPALSTVAEETILAEVWIARTMTVSIVAEMVRALTSRRNAVIVRRQITITTPAIRAVVLRNLARTMRLNRALIPRRVRTQRQITVILRQAAVGMAAEDTVAVALIAAAVVAATAAEVPAEAVLPRATVPVAVALTVVEVPATAVAALPAAISNLNHCAAA